MLAPTPLITQLNIEVQKTSTMQGNMLPLPQPTPYLPLKSTKVQKTSTMQPTPLPTSQHLPWLSLFDMEAITNILMGTQLI